MENCPDCGAHLSGGWTHRTREVIELPVVPVQVTEHVYIARTCPACRRRCTPPAELDGVVLGQQRLRRQPAQPDRHAAGRGAAAHPQRPVVSGHRASVAPQRGGHRERHPSHGAAGPTSGGRDPGPHPRQPSGPRRRNRLASERANGYVWTFSTPTERYFPCSSQGQALLRDIHDLRTLYPDAAPLARWADAVHGIYDRAKACTHPQAKRRRTAQLALERQLLALCQPFRHDPSVTQAKLCRRIERHIRELFVFVAEPDVPADNNAAERSLRHLVISRKVSGGTRSEQGTERKMTLASIFGTWRAQGLNPLAACRQLLVSPRL